MAQRITGPVASEERFRAARRWRNRSDPSILPSALRKDCPIRKDPQTGSFSYDGQNRCDSSVAQGGGIEEEITRERSIARRDKIWVSLHAEEREKTGNPRLSGRGFIARDCVIRSMRDGPRRTW